MWNLSGDDVQRAKEELKGRRAAIQARYDSEMKQLDTAIGDIETFERAAVNFVANFKAEDTVPSAVAEPVPMPEPAVAESVEEQPSADPEPVAVAEPEPVAVVDPEPVAAEPAPSEKGSSRWRMRLSGTEASP